MTNQQNRICKAKSLLLLDHPFFGTLIARTPFVEDTAVDTMATNGKRVRYNTEFVDGLTDPHLMGVLAHEVMHVAYGHCWRRSFREPKQWNVATDYAINSIILEAGLTLPEGALISVALHGAAEDIYATLEQEPDESDTSPADTKDPADEGTDDEGGDSKDASNNNVEANDPGRCCAVEDIPADEVDEQQAEWNIAIAQAEMAASGQGELPAGLARMVKEILDPSVPWHILLRDLVERSARNDYNWTRPSRRHIGRGIILPSLISEEIPDIVVAVDTSGSISQAVLDVFAAEASAILGAYNTTIHVVYCDREVQHTQEFTRADMPLELEPHGGGGTAFQPVFDWVGEQYMTPACLIYLTDGLGKFPTEEPDYPVLWALVGEYNVQPTFGDVANVTI